MNIKRKLTLITAAIFMITLTIVGVTYAYCLTKKNYSSSSKSGNNTTVVEGIFHDGVKPTLKNLISGEKLYHLFAIENPGKSSITRSIALGTYLEINADGSLVNPQFVHSNLNNETILNPQVNSGFIEGVGALDATCFMSDEAAIAYNNNGVLDVIRTNCYNGDYYNNIFVRLYKLNGYNGVEITDDEVNAGTYTIEQKNAVSSLITETVNKGSIDEFKKIDLSTKGLDYSKVEAIGIALNKLKANGYSCLLGGDGSGNDGCGDASLGIGPETAAKNLPFYNGSAALLNKDGNAIILALNQTINAKSEDKSTFNYYLLEVEYISNNQNQNIETEAFVGIKVDTINGDIETSK